LDKGPSGRPQCIATVSSNTVPLTFPLAQDLSKGTSSTDWFAMTCVIPDTCAGHVIRRQGRSLKQVADISSAWVAAFSIKDQVGPVFGQHYITIWGTESQISAALGVVGKRFARQQVRTPRPLEKGKDMHAGEKQQPLLFSIPVNPPAGPAPANHPLPPCSYPPASETPSSRAYELTHPTETSVPMPMDMSHTTTHTTSASPMSVIPNTIPAMPIDIGVMTTPAATGRQPPTSVPQRSEWVPPQERVAQSLPHSGNPSDHGCGMPLGNYAHQGGGG